MTEDVKAGSYIEPENIRDYNTVIRKYIDNGEILKEEGVSGYEFAKENFDRNKLARKYIDAIGKAAEKNRI